MAERGREASRPWQIPPGGWKDVLRRVKDEMATDNIDIVAAGVAFYWLLSLFPAVVAAVSIWGLVADPAQVQQLLQTAAQTMPQQAQALLSSQVQDIVGQPTALGVGTVVGILAALWSANKGTKSLMAGLNVAYDETEARGFFSLNLQAFGLLLVAVVVGAAAALGVIVVPAIVDSLPLGVIGAWIIRILRWPLLGLGLLAFLALVYRYGPSRANPRWTWASVGALVATVLWLVASALFSLYVSRFGSYNETYGSLAGVVIMLLWFWITAYVVLIGAELNAELERQTKRDTTTGEPEPMGERGAFVADHLPDGEPEPT